MTEAQEGRYFKLCQKVGAASLDGNITPEFVCLGCGKEFGESMKAAMRAAVNGCPKCRKFDIDVQEKRSFMFPF